MPSLKDLRNRIASVKSTQKITKAMQMVAVSKLRRAQAAAEAARPYADKVEAVLANLAGGEPPGGDRRRGCSPATAPTRPICWSSAPASAASAAASTPRSCAWRAIAPTRSRREGKTVKILCVGKKGFDQLRRTHEKAIIEHDRPARACARSPSRPPSRSPRRDRDVRDGRVRRLHVVLRALQVGDLADPDRAAAHSAGARRRRTNRRRPTTTSPTRAKSCRSCCRGR